MTNNPILIFSSKYYKQILLQLKSAGAEARLIGGCVRDSLLKKTSYDIDIATNLLPNQITGLLSKAKIKVIPTGIKFGTVTAILKGEKFEITTLRKDLQCNGRHAQVIFTNNFQEDALRRDFTVNALSYCPFENKLYDYFNGIADLNNRRVIFIGEPCERINEDYLRILRFFRFSALYAKEIDKDGFEACKKLKNGLNILSKERIKQEIDKLLISDRAAEILQQMFDSGILQLILPVNLYNQKFLEQATCLKLRSYTKYSLLFYDLSPTIDDLIKIKFSRTEATKIIAIISFIKQEQITQFIMKKTWLEKSDYTEYLLAAVIIGNAEIPTTQEFINKYNMLARPNFPLTGHDLLKLNIKNKDIGLLLEKLKSLWIKSDFKLTKEGILVLAQERI